MAEREFMGQLGLGAMIHLLGGGSENSSSKYVGKKIVDAKIDDDDLLISFEDGVKIKIFDDGQSCCESRYVTCDDDVTSLIGHNLLHIAEKEGPETEGEYGECHDTCFIEVATDGGFITMTTHNEHNGYYGGFVLNIVEISKEDE